MKYKFKTIKGYSTEPKIGYTACLVTESSTRKHSTGETIYVKIPHNVSIARILDLAYYFDEVTNSYKERDAGNRNKPTAFNRHVLQVYSRSNLVFETVENIETIS